MSTAGKLVVVVRSMVTADLILKTVLRLGLGLGVLAAAAIVPDPLGHWLHVIGAVFLMFALYQAIGHAEGKVMAHAVSWIGARRAARQQRNRERMEQLAYCRRCGCGSCPYDPANRPEAKP